MSPVPLPPSPWDFDPEAWPEDDCVAAGADLEPSTVVAAYR
ncbi:MAG: leucyl/phenylalanyl-tRNA--protein transferase, partial [Actinomycetales bacterium]